MDAIGKWGSTNFVRLGLDRTGSISKILYMTPNPTNGTVVAEGSPVVVDFGEEQVEPISAVK